MEFDWNPEKALINQKKHQVSFVEASTVFNDPLAMTFDDPSHSISEQRYITMGFSDQNRLIVVSYTERNDKIRIISGRLATPREKRFYEQGEL
jgi:hypothetical protein